MSIYRFPLLLCLVVGCAQRSGVDDAIASSSSYRRAQDIGGSRARWFLEGTDSGYPVFFVGFDEGTHTTRAATLRVREHGLVEREEMREDGELIWVEDK